MPEKVPVLPPPDVDMVLHVRTPWFEGRDHLEFKVYGSAGRETTIRGPRLRRSPYDFQQRLFARLEALHRRRDIKGGSFHAQEAFDELRGICLKLFRDLFPPELYDDMKAQEVQTLLILSEEPWIPWELLLPGPDDDFFCMQFQMSRWLVQREGFEMPLLVSSKRVAKILGMSGGDLESAGRELTWLEDFASKIPGLEGRSFPELDAKKFITAIQNHSFHLLHFAGHGEKGDAGSESRLYLANRRPLHAGLLPIDAEAKVREESPLVFFNACEVGRMEESLTGLDGFAPRWIQHFGCSAFIAPILLVNDQRAYEFATHFYSFLRDGQRLGEAFRSARHELRQSEPYELAWLVYSLFGHPGAEITFGDCGNELPKQDEAMETKGDLRALKDVRHTVGDVFHRAALRIDRAQQWAPMVKICGTEKNALFLLHGSKQQNLDLFVSRVKHYLSSECKVHHRPIVVPLKHEYAKPRTAGAWENHLRREIAGEGRGGTAEELLREAARYSALFLVLSHLPIAPEDLDEVEISALEAFLGDRLPKLIANASGANPIRALLATDYNCESTSLVASLDAQALAGCQRYGVKYRKLQPLRALEWGDIEDFLDDLEPRPPKHVYRQLRAAFGALDHSTLQFRDQVELVARSLY